jgi:hypothetical protein
MECPILLNSIWNKKGTGDRACLNLLGGTNARRLAKDVEARLDINSFFYD